MNLERVVPHCVVALSYQVSDTLGEVLSATEPGEAEEFFIGGDDLLPKIQDALIGQTPGTALNLHLEPEDAFGDYNANWVQVEPRDAFPLEVDIGMQFEGLPEGCGPHESDRIYTVTDVTDDVVVLDGNHPLAGIAVRFSITLHSIRDASEDEMQASSTSQDDEALRVLSPVPAPPRMQ
jgi:FKBP-type peptidyl-prolyl cis-trans isomerase SlyD